MGVLVLGFGGLTLGLAGLLTTAWVGRPPWLRSLVPALALICGLLSGLGLLSEPTLPTVWWPALVFVGLVPTMLLLPLPWLGRLYSQLVVLLRTRRLQAAFWIVLMIASPVGALILALHPGQKMPDLFDGLGQGLSELRDNQQPLQEVKPGSATTDRGRPVPLFAPQGPVLPAPDPELVLKQTDLLKNLGLGEQVIRLGLGWQNCNCHGWIFTGGHFWIRSEEVGLILRDNGYKVVDLPRPGDLAIYRDPQGLIVHSGLVRYVGGPALILVESKWGRLGRLLHMFDVHCYDQASCSFYRSRRPGHLLYGLPRSSDPFPAASDSKVSNLPRGPHH